MLDNLRRKIGFKLADLARVNIRYGTSREIERGLNILRLTMRIMPTYEDRRWDYTVSGVYFLDEFR